MLGTNNIGFNNSNLSPMESLVNTLLHESYHIKHWELFQSNVQANGNDFNAAFTSMADQGYSLEFLWTFFDVSGGQGNVTFNENYADDIHQFIENWNLPYIDNAIEEFNNDLEEYQNYLQNLQD